MAASLGSLVVSMGLDAAEFTAGLTKQEFNAKKFAKTLEKSIDAGAKAAAASLAAMTAGAAASFAVFDRLVKSASDFQDLADITGAGAEEWASYSSAAGGAGVEVASLAEAANKLTKNLVGVDDEAKAAGAALAAIGINVADFKKLNPAEQYEAAANAINSYADGAGKSAVAQALFGKSGTEQLKVFKTLEEQGGRNIILTAEMIRQADEYAGKQDKARAELTQYAQVMATQAIPALTVLTSTLSDAAKEMLGLGDKSKDLKNITAIQDFAFSAVKALAFVVDAGDGVARVFRIAGTAIGGAAASGALAAQGQFSAAREAAKLAKADIDAILDVPQFSSKLDARIADMKAQTALFRQENRGFTPETKPQISFNGATKAAKEIKDVVTESEKYYENLQKQLDKTRELNAEETLLSEVQQGRLKITGKYTLEQLQAMAREIDLTKEATRVSTERQAQRTKDYEDSIAAVRELEEAERSRLKGFLDNTPSAILEKQRSDVEFLTKAFEDARISEQQYLEAVTARLDLGAKEIEKQKSLADELGLSFTSAFEDAIAGGKSFSDVLKGLEQDIIRIISRKLVTEPLGNAISGAFSGGSDIFGSLIGSIFGKATGGYAQPFSLTQVNENGPELFDYRGKKFMATGQSGVSVTPNSRLGGGVSQTIVFQSTGAIDRRTQTQLAAAALSGVRAGQRNL